jgi:hypothetical protein
MNIHSFFYLLQRFLSREIGTGEEHLRRQPSNRTVAAAVFDGFGTDAGGRLTT